MHFREYDAERDRDSVQRMWRGIGWLKEGQEEAVDLFIAASHALVAEVDGDAEGLVGSMPGQMRYQQEELSLSAITTVSVGRRVRKRGVARRLVAQLLAADAADGAHVAALGMFEQGYYNRLGFGTGSYEHWMSFDPAQLRVANPRRIPRHLLQSDWAVVHSSRLRRMRDHGSCNVLPPQITRAEMMTAKNGFGFGYFDGDGQDLTHHLWCSTTDPEFGPYTVLWMAYGNWDQFLELLGVIRGLGDQVRLIKMREPPGIQLQDLLEKPFAQHRARESGKLETTSRAIAYWQVRICDLGGCLERTHLQGRTLRFNLELDDPIESYLGEDASWRGLRGRYVVTLGPRSGAAEGHDEALPTLRASVGAFTRLWLGVQSATSLSVTDGLKGPPALLQELDGLLRCLPAPKWDWDF
jgi:GNAT superfamily N-acetyltransferase